MSDGWGNPLYNLERAARGYFVYKIVLMRQAISIMYTGIIQALCPVTTLEDKPGLKSFVIELPPQLTTGLQLGASVSLDGVCFTVTTIDGQLVGFDAMQETLETTTIGSLKQGDSVNIERSAKMGDEIGGHPMSGHVSAMAEIVLINESENNKSITFKVDPEWMRFIFSKGFVGLDGLSLTVVDAQKDSGEFKVFFIPESLKLTRFGSKQVSDFVNVEIDPQTQVIVETVERVMAERG